VGDVALPEPCLHAARRLRVSRAKAADAALTKARPCVEARLVPLDGPAPTSQGLGR